MGNFLYKYRYQLPALGYAILIFILSSIPGDEIPELGIRNIDKVVHLIEYTIFGVLLIVALRNNSHAFHYQNWQVLLFCYGIGYGMLDEFHQLFVTNRIASFSDLLFDSLGIMCSYILYKVFWQRWANPRVTIGK